MRICGCTSDGHECESRGGCICHELAASLGREPTDAEVAEAELAWAKVHNRAPAAWVAPS